MSNSEPKMTERRRRREIRERFRDREPLNLSAVENDCPWLLEGLFEPDNFVGWKETVEAAGVSIDEILVHPAIGLRCEICGVWEDGSLAPHLKHTHGINAFEYRLEFPKAEVICEESRAQRLGLRHGRGAKALLPHWEPAWSWRYALDRIHTMHRSGLDVNYNAIAKAEAGLAAYLRRVFGSWDAALAAAGLDPKQERKASQARTFNRDEVIAQLRRAGRKKKTAADLHIAHARVADRKSFMFAIFEKFTSYEAALQEADLDPGRFIPALGDPAMVRRRQQLLTEIRRRLETAPDYNLEDAGDLLRRAAPVVNAFYGSWPNLAVSLGVYERDIFNSPEHTAYDSRKLVIQALRARAAAGLSLRASNLRTDNVSLLMMAEKHFENYPKSLATSKVEREPRMLDARHYRTPDSVTAELRRRHETGLSLYAIDVLDEDKPLHKWSLRYFGAYPDALKAAGLPDLGTKPHSFPERVRYPDGDGVLTEIRARRKRGDSLDRDDMRKPMAEGGDGALYKAACQFFPSWLSALKAAGCEPARPPARLPRNSPGRYQTRADVIAALRRREAEGMSLKTIGLLARREHGGDTGLYNAALRLFSAWREALKAAGVNVAATVHSGEG